MHTLQWGAIIAVVCVLINLIPATKSQYDCFRAPANPEDRRHSKNKLTVGSFNAEWLFLEYYSSSKCPGSGCPWKNSSEAELHAKDIAKVIKSIDVDILILAEVENCNVLSAIFNEIGDATYKYYLLKGTDTATGQNVALFTRIDPIIDLKRTENRTNFPIEGSKCGSTNKGSSGVSKHLHTRFKIENLKKELVLIGAHLIAFPDVPDRCSQREAQATVLQGLAMKEAVEQDRHILIMGDFNDFDNSFRDAASDVAISQVLNILKSDYQNNTYMINAVSLMPIQSKRWSCWYDKDQSCNDTPNEHTLIDHVLVSKELSSFITEVRVPHELYIPECGSYFSDHWPIIVTLELN